MDDRKKPAPEDDEALASVTGGAGRRGGGHVLCPYCMSELVSLRGIHAHYGVEYFCPGCGERFAGYNDQMVRRQIEYARRLTHTLGASAAKEQLKESKNGVKDLL